MLCRVGNKLIVMDEKNKSVFDKQAQTHQVITVLQQRIIGNAVTGRLITVLVRYSVLS